MAPLLQKPTVTGAISSIFADPRKKAAVRPGPTVEAAAALPSKPAAAPTPRQQFAGSLSGGSANQPYGGTPSADDPAMIGGRLEQERIERERAAKADVPKTETPNPAAPKPEAAPVEAPKPDRLDPLREAYRTYIGSLVPSQATSDARRKYADFLGAEEQGLNRLADQPIASQFITGQQSSLRRQNEAEAARLQRDVTLAQEADTGTQAQNLARVQFAQSLAEQERLQAADEASARKPIEVGGVLLDPVTFQPLYTPPVGEADKPTSVQEYEYAKANGYTGSFADYQNEDANRKVIAARAGDDPTRILSAVEAQTLGVPFGTRASEAYGKTPTKPLTEAQSKAALFGERTSQAEDVIAQNEQLISTMNPVSYRVQENAEASALGNVFISDVVRQQRQAERNFLNSILRRESGAVISSSEFENGAKQYFPRPGDDAGTLAQKAQNRATAIEALQKEGLVQETQTYIAPDGTEYEQGTDGKYYPKASSGEPTASTTGLRNISVGGRQVTVDASIADRLASAARDFKAATGRELEINQHYRTREEQERLYRELSAKGARVAPPGKSFHEKGLAIDVTNWKEAEPYLRKYGLVNDLPDDRGHFSYGETNRV